ncbi:hypothetical protein C0J52_20542 [Blattella germanica]|nr:hypothetical protein C0J52_20542 [Blattella germanica]
MALADVRRLDDLYKIIGNDEGEESLIRLLQGEGLVKKCTRCPTRNCRSNTRLVKDGCVVQVDESVVTRRKYNRGRLVKEQWVVGIYDTSLRRGIVLFVSRRDRQTLVPLIRDYVLPGTTIYTDGWSGYTGLNRAGYTHMVVNHRDHFVDPTTGACTNAVEGYWSKLKGFLRQTNTLKSTLLPEHIDEFMWREAYCQDAHPFKKILEGIRERYPL